MLELYQRQAAQHTCTHTHSRTHTRTRTHTHTHTPTHTHTHIHTHTCMHARTHPTHTHYHHGGVTVWTAGTGAAELLPQHGGPERPTTGQQCGVHRGGPAHRPLPSLLLLLLPQHTCQGTKVSTWIYMGQDRMKG